MDKRLTFNEAAGNYDKWRPTYCDELFKDVIAYSQINEGKKAIEIGIGTGQATRPFLETGCEITAIELGENLAAFSKFKFRDYKNFKIYNTTFEDYKCPEDSIDVIYSATAFHWIPEDIGYPKVFKQLKRGGTLALFWNRPFVSREDDELHRNIKKIYQKYSTSHTEMIEHDIQKYEYRKKTIKAYGFRDVNSKLYHLTRTFTSSDYIALLNTYSDHRTMPSTTKEFFETEIKDAIMSFGDVLHVYDTIDLYLARK